jgi:hypothetical protein
MVNKDFTCNSNKDGYDKYFYYKDGSSIWQVYRDGKLFKDKKSRKRYARFTRKMMSHCIRMDIIYK